MAYDKDLDRLMNTTVVVSTGGPSSRNKYGVETWSTGGSTFDARWVDKTEELRGPNGDVELAVGHVYISSTAAFSTNARVQSSTGEWHRVLRVEKYPDEDGPHHVKLMLGSRSGGR